MGSTKGWSRGLSTIIGLSAAAVSFSVWAFPIELAESPGTNLRLTLKAIKSAKNTLAINIYEFTSPEIKDAVIEKIREGIQVRILEEGQPVGGFSQAAKNVLGEITEAMEAQRGSNHYYVMSSKQRTVKRRYRFDHGKYIIIDEKALLIGSENYSPTGQPVSGNKGNRGWEVLLNNPEMAQEYLRIFEEDIDPSYGDISEGLPGSSSGGAGGGGGEDDDEDDDTLRRHNSVYSMALSAKDSFLESFGFTAFSSADQDLAQESSLEFSPGLSGADLDREAEAAGSLQGQSASPELSILKINADQALKITSPDTSLSGLTDLIRGARKHLDIELMTFDYHWGGPNGNSPLFKEVVDAAARGVQVRVLLNDERAFSPSAKQKNLVTVKAFNKIAKDRGYSVEAAIANLKAMKVKIIHNKGVLADGDTTLVSSINWNQNSVMNNRETAVVLKSSNVYQYYHDLFDKDWANRLIQ